VPNGRPSLPGLAEGFAMTGASSSKQWQFGVPSIQLQNLSRAVDIAAGLAKSSTSLSTSQQTVQVDTLVRGPDGRVYTYVQTASSPPTCTFMTLNDTMIKRYVHGAALPYANYSWLEDVVVQGEPMHMFAIPELFMQVVIGGETPPAATGAGALLFVRVADLKPMWSTSSIEWAEDDWDANQGLQAVDTRMNFTSFTLGKPETDFSVPSSWGDCHEAPPPDDARPEAMMQPMLPEHFTERLPPSSALVQV